MEEKKAIEIFPAKRILSDRPSESEVAWLTLIKFDRQTTGRLASPNLGYRLARMPVNQSGVSLRLLFHKLAENVELAFIAVWNN